MNEKRDLVLASLLQVTALTYKRYNSTTTYLISVSPWKNSVLLPV